MTIKIFWSYGGDSMATAFTEQETEYIQKALKEAAGTFALSQGVRKTTVDQLTEKAGISKGAFYKFYPSKEMLFFELLEDMHSDIYALSSEKLAENPQQNDAERVAQAVLAACRIMDERGIMTFIERDSAYLLRKVPEDVKKKHYHSDSVHITELLQEAGLKPRGGTELAAATVRGLFLTVSHKSEIGEAYDEVLKTLVYGACNILFS